MLQIRPDPRDENPPPVRRKQTVCRRGQDLHQIRHSRICEESSAGAGGQEVCRSDSCHNVFFRGAYCIALFKPQIKIITNNGTGKLRSQRLVVVDVDHCWVKEVSSKEATGLEDPAYVVLPLITGDGATRAPGAWRGKSGYPQRLLQLGRDRVEETAWYICEGTLSCMHSNLEGKEVVEPITN